MQIIRGVVVRGAMAMSVAALVALAPGVAMADPGDPIDLGGTQVKTTDSPRKPVALKAGLWSATMKAGDFAQQQYSYRRTETDSSVHISVTATAGESGESLKLEAFDEDNKSCGSETVSASYSTPWVAMGVDLEIGPAEHGDRNATCLRADVIRFAVGPSGSTRDSESDMPLTIKIVEESSLKNSDEKLPLPAESGRAFRSPSAGSDHGEVSGDRSFDGAPQLKAGTSSSSITEGEQLIYRVHLDWGQSLAAALDVVAYTEAEIEPFGYTGPSLELGVYSPMRRVLSSDFEGTSNSGSVSTEPLELTTGVGPVRYLNRYDDEKEYLPGDYYLSVVAPDIPDERDPKSIDFTLSVEVQGKVGGAPTYVDPEPFLVGNGERSSVASGNPAPPVAEPGWFTKRRIGGLGVGLVGLVALLAGALRLRRS